MSKNLIAKIKQNVAKTGGNRGNILYIKDGEKVRIRFLQDMDEGFEFVFHDSFSRSINSLCLQHVGKECPLCDDDDVRTRDNYVWSVYDHDAKAVKMMLFAANGITPLQQLLDYYEANGDTILDRDYIIKRTGKGMETKWTVMPQDKSKFRNEKVKPYSESAITKMLLKAFPNKDVTDDDDEDDDDDEVEVVKDKSKKKPASLDYIEDALGEEDIDEDEFCEFLDISSLKTLVKKGASKKKIKVLIKKYIDSLEEEEEEDDEDED